MTIEDHDFSVYRGKSKEEIINILKPHENRIEIADIMVDIGLLESNPFNSGFMYAPYIPLLKVDLNGNIVLNSGILTRYGSSTIDKSKYSKINL